MLIPDEWLDRATHTLRVLTHPHRLRICERLLAGERPVGDLADAMDLKQNVVSQHLTHLRAHGIVQPRRAGRNVMYRVVHPGPGWCLILFCPRFRDRQRHTNCPGIKQLGFHLVFQVVYLLQQSVNPCVQIPRMLIL